MEQNITLSACCMSEHDELVLQSLINIIDLRSNANWSFASDDIANVLIIDVDSQEGRQFWTGLDSSVKDRVAIAYGVNREGLSGNAQYLLDKPLRSKKVMDLLEEVTRQELNNVDFVDTRVEGVAEAEHRRQFIQKLKELFDAGGWGIRYKNQMLIINGEGNEAYTAEGLEQVSVLAEAPEINLEINELTKSDIQSAKERLKVFKIDQVIWFFARYHSQALVSQLSGNKEFRIKRWPNLKKIKYDRDDIRLFGLLMKNWMTVDALKESAPAESVIGLINALYMTGFLLMRDSQAMAQASASKQASTHTGLYSRIRRRLGIA